MVNIVLDAGAEEISALNEEGQVLGSLRYTHPEDSSKDRNIVLYWLYVEPPYRRRGIGSALLNFAQSNLTYTWLFLWTAQEMEESLSYPIYVKMGFEQLTYMPDYYAPSVGTRQFGYKKLSVP